jgi:hypothetical protein
MKVALPLDKGELQGVWQIAARKGPLDLLFASRGTMQLLKEPSCEL